MQHVPTTVMLLFTPDAVAKALNGSASGVSPALPQFSLQLDILYVFLPDTTHGCDGALQASMRMGNQTFRDVTVFPKILAVSAMTAGRHKLCLAPTSQDNVADKAFQQLSDCVLTVTSPSPGVPPLMPPFTPSPFLPPVSPPPSPPLVLLRVNNQISAAEAEMFSGELSRVQFEGGAVQPGGRVAFATGMPPQDQCNITTAPSRPLITVDASTSLDLRLEGGVDYTSSGNYTLCYLAPNVSNETAYIHFANTRIIVLHRPPSAPPGAPPPQSPPSSPPTPLLPVSLPSQVSVSLAVVGLHDQCMTPYVCIVYAGELTTISLFGINDSTRVAFVPRNGGPSASVCENAFSAAMEQFTDMSRGSHGFELHWGGKVIVRLSTLGEHAVCVAEDESLQSWVEILDPHLKLIVRLLPPSPLPRVPSPLVRLPPPPCNTAAISSALVITIPGIASLVTPTTAVRNLSPTQYLACIITTPAYWSHLLSNHECAASPLGQAPRLLSCYSSTRADVFREGTPFRHCWARCLQMARCVHLICGIP